MAQRIQVRRGTRDEWLLVDPIPWQGEICLEEDTRRWKFGDGVNKYSLLDYTQEIPAHEWDGTKLRFQNPDGSWGEWRDLSVMEGDYYDYIPQETPLPHKEGRTFYDGEEQALTLYTENSDVAQQLGRELWADCWNDTAVTIPNGTPIYIVDALSARPTIDLASCTTYDKSRVLAVTTQDILPGERGFVTKFGIVRGINTSALTTGTLYLGEVPGTLTNDKPTGGCFVTNLGVCLVSDDTNGSVFVDINTTELTVEVTDTNGFSSEQRDNTSITSVDATRTVTVSATSYPFHVYQYGQKFEFIEPQSVVITNTEGLHAIYFNDGVLTALANPSSGQEDDLIRNKCLVCYVYWNAAAGKFEKLLNERHGISMSPASHAYNHFTRGAQFLMGLGLGNFALGAGTLNSDCQFSVSSGMITDEDLPSFYAGVTSTVGLPINYLSGATGNLRISTLAGFSVLTDVAAGVGSTGRLVYNLWNGATWSLTTAPDNTYVLCHVFMDNNIDATKRVFAQVGQASYANISAARAGAATEIASLRYSLPEPELVPIGTIIFQTRDTYANSVKARIVATDTGDNYVDWRTTELAQGIPPTDHQNLTNRTAVGSHPASAISVDASGFTGNLTSADDDVQKALATLDAMSGGSEVEWSTIDTVTITEATANVLFDGLETGKTYRVIWNGVDITGDGFVRTTFKEGTTARTQKAYTHTLSGSGIGSENISSSSYIDWTYDQYLAEATGDGHLILHNAGQQNVWFEGKGYQKYNDTSYQGRIVYASSPTTAGQTIDALDFSSAGSTFAAGTFRLQERAY